MDKTALYRTIWRWHFYAGLFVLPFILILSLSGAAYLFKPQIDRWEERNYLALGTAGAVSANAQAAAALAAFPGARFYSYRLPRAEGDATMIHLGMPDGRSMRDVFVSPQGKVLGSIDPENRISALISKFHGSLMIGTLGDRLVELAASWAIVMILTGLYLWWPSGRGLAGILWPRIGLGGRAFLKDLHAVTGFWVSGLALVLLLTGLPWAGVWGDAFRTLRAEMGWVQGAQNWKVGAGSGHSQHAEHDHEAMLRQQAAGIPLTSLADMVAKARAEQMAFPVIVIAPGSPQPFGPPTGMVWTVKSESQNRPLQRSVTYDMASGKELSRSGIADKHPIDRIINYGIAWHEGQLFGWINQLIGVLTAAALITLAASGFLMWRRRKPANGIGAPPLPAQIKLRGIIAIILTLAALLPLLAASLMILWLIERLILPHFPHISAWLGMKEPTAA
ncbi:MAG: PepSY domain-containing protein [Sphingobium sp.]|nr:PepSY domain-containing protein [Sphingobium sp.]MCP5399846.1 PepSY domain-containing protein [Sphingomonas sp.]